MKRDAWNRCDVCGKFIPLADFGNGAVRTMLNPDAYGCEETWETLCLKHGLEDRARMNIHQHVEGENNG